LDGFTGTAARRPAPISLPFLKLTKTVLDQVQNMWIEACRELSDTFICRVCDDESITIRTLRLDEGPIELTRDP